MVEDATGKSHHLRVRVGCSRTHLGREDAHSKQRAAGRAVLMAGARKRALDLAPTIAELRAAGCKSLRDIAAGLDQRGISAAKGGKWSATQVMRLLEAAAGPFSGHHGGS